MKKLALVFGMALVLGIGSAAQAAIVTVADSPNGEDTYVETQATDIRGNRVEIRTHHVSRYLAYLRFDVSGYVPGTYTGTSTLNLYADGGGQARVQNVFVVDDGATGDAAGDWDETTLTRDNDPAYNPAALGSFTGGGAAGWDSFSTGLTDFLNADTNGLVTLVLQTSDSSGGGTSSQWYSKEGNSGNTPPELVFTADPVPEPSSFILAALGLLGLIGFGRRRKR